MSSGSTLLLMNPEDQDKSEQLIKSIENLDNVYSVKTYNVWEIEKGQKVVTLHVVVKYDSHAEEVKNMIRK